MLNRLDAGDEIETRVGIRQQLAIEINEIYRNVRVLHKLSGVIAARLLEPKTIADQLQKATTPGSNIEMSQLFGMRPQLFNLFQDDLVNERRARDKFACLCVFRSCSAMHFGSHFIMSVRDLRCVQSFTATKQLQAMS